MNQQFSPSISSKLVSCILHWHLSENSKTQEEYISHFEKHNELFNDIASLCSIDEDVDDIIYYLLDNYVLIQKDSNNSIN